LSELTPVGPSLVPSRNACSPLAIRMARPPRMGPWRGPLPRRRITPLPILGSSLLQQSWWRFALRRCRW
jgi:hypothetical protein